MANYLALIDRTSGLFGVVIPDCPGCYAAGHTCEEAVTHAAEALDEWLADRLADGFEAPRRRGIDELRADPSLADDLARGAIIVLVPTAIGDVGPDPVLDARLMRQVSEAAIRSGTTVAAFLAAAARDRIAEGR